MDVKSVWWVVWLGPLDDPPAWKHVETWERQVLGPINLVWWNVAMDRSSV